MTRDEMIDFLIRGFLDDTSRLSNEEIHDMREQWMAQAPVEWLPIAIDIALHPPDLSLRGVEPHPHWDVEEEFILGVVGLLRRWYPYAPTAWIREMTPLLNNEVAFAPNMRYSTAREIALSALGGRSKEDINLLLDWLEPLIEKWDELTENERGLFVGELNGLYWWQQNSKARQLLLGLQAVVEEPYKQSITETLTYVEQREEEVRKQMKQHQDFAHDWIAAWNAHDVDRIMSHYAEDVEYQSPFVDHGLGAENYFGILVDSVSVRPYVKHALQTFPDLHFELLGVFGGVDSVVLHYRGVDNLIAAEFFQFNRAGKISRVVAHYSSLDFVHGF